MLSHEYFKNHLRCFFGGRFKTPRETEERLHKAYESVKNGEMTLRQASEVYEVPNSTLHDQIMGKVLFGSHSGPR